MVYVDLKPGETFDSLLRRWKTRMERENVTREYKRHLRFTSASQRRRQKQTLARRRQQEYTRKSNARVLLKP